MHRLPTIASLLSCFVGAAVLTVVLSLGNLHTLNVSDAFEIGVPEHKFPQTAVLAKTDCHVVHAFRESVMSTQVQKATRRPAWGVFGVLVFASLVVVIDYASRSIDLLAFGALP